MTPGEAVMPTTGGTYHGLPTLRLANGAAWVEALAGAGPRIVGLGRGVAGPNLLAETPDVAWETPAGTYRLLGGHRLWLAPEAAGLSATPDHDGLAATATPGGGLRLDGARDPGTGLVRSMEVRLVADRPVVEVRHEVHNAGGRRVELAPWAITQLPLGGRAIVPQPRPTTGHETRPERLVVLWPYASPEDARLAVRDGYLAVDGQAGPDLKVGCRADAGWIAWVRDGVALVRRFPAARWVPYPDLGANAEVFVGARYQELEVLGPLAWLAPGDTVSLDERWELRPVPPAATLDDLVDTLTVPLPPVDPTPAAA